MSTSISTSSVATTTNYYVSQSSVASGADANKTSNSAAEVTTANNVTNEVKQQPTPEQLVSLVNEGNAIFRNAGSSLQFNIDNSIGQVVVKIIDSKTNEVIRQIPTVDMVNFIRHMKELEAKAGSLQAGAIVNLAV